MLRMSKLADYGALILSTMARQPEQVQSAAGIAVEIRVPLPTVSKILKILTREQLVISLRGARGGYLLARSSTEISVAQIIDAMDGPIGMTECSIAQGLCSQENSCSVRPNWQHVNRVVLQALEKITLEQMIQPITESVDISAIESKRFSSRKTVTTHQ
jgi:FeS assembly SUF system regulator